MKNRYEKIKFEDGEGINFEAMAKKGRNFEISEGTNGELIIKAIDVSVANIEINSSENYANPPIPKGYRHTEGNWYNGFVIQRKLDESEFVWIPVGFLDANGTIDGENFDEKFGRRNYRGNEFSKDEFYEEMTEELRSQKESVEKYGGFYISRYDISKTSIGMPQSKKGVMPWVNISFNDAQKVASYFENSETVKSHLTYSCEYDSVLEWFIKSGARTVVEIAENSTNWGNHWNTEKAPGKVVETGFREQWCTNHIYDFAGNIDEWAQEQYNSSFGVIRGGMYNFSGNNSPAAYRYYVNQNGNYDSTGFRVTLFIK